MRYVTNKLIAEFMGLETPDGCYFEHLTKEGNRELTHHILLEYHTSWDWLMPVVSKILTNENYIDLTQRENIMDSLPYGMIEDTYDAVVKFIKWYNNQSK